MAPMSNEQASSEKMTAFYEARALGFEELYVEDSAVVPSTSVPSPSVASELVPEAPKKSGTKRPLESTDSTPPKRLRKSARKTPHVFEEKPNPVRRKLFAADKHMVAEIQAEDLAKEKKLASEKLAREKLNAQRLATKEKLAAARLASATESADPRPTKRIKLNGPRPPPSAATKKQALKKDGEPKKDPVRAVEQGFQGIPSGLGTTTNSPPGPGTLSTPWSCGNLQCDTGMTWFPRETTNGNTGVGRKVTSQFFGRNKGATKLIPSNVWHFFCRKDYQRAKYAADKGTDRDATYNYYASIFRAQFSRLQLWRPNALFKVQLHKSAADRLAEYDSVLRAHGGNTKAAMAALPAPNPKKPEAAYPIELLVDFDYHFKSTTATADYQALEQIVAWALREISNGTTTMFVPVEFLINDVQKGEVLNDTHDNYASWADLNKPSDGASGHQHDDEESVDEENVVESIERVDEDEDDDDDVVFKLEHPQRVNLDTLPISVPETDPLYKLHVLSAAALHLGYDARDANH